MWLTWEDHQQHGLLQSKDFQCCCFFAGDVRQWLDAWPEDAFYFEELYSEWAGATGRDTPASWSRFDATWEIKRQNGYESPNKGRAQTERGRNQLGNKWGCGRPVEITTPTGEVRSFNKVREALEFVPFSDGTLRKLTSGQKESYAGYTAKLL